MSEPTPPVDEVVYEVLPDHEELDPDTIVSQVRAYVVQLRDDATAERAKTGELKAAAGDAVDEQRAAEVEAERCHRRAAQIDFAASECDRALQLYRDGAARLAEDPDADVDMAYLLAVLRGKRGVQAPNQVAQESSP